MSFWGPNMTKVLEWAHANGINYGPMSPAQFAQVMDERLGAQHMPHEDVEDTAAMWLKVIDDRPTSSH